MPMGDGQRGTWAQIDLDALAHNYAVVRARIPHHAKMCCVLKANAYGHGALAAAQLYETMGADFFAVSNVEEALQLRRGGSRVPILILGYTPVAFARRLAEQSITQCVYSYEYGCALAEAATQAGVCIDVHFKLDTGMGRIGFAFCDHDADREDSLRDIVRLAHCGALSVQGIFTHFAVADEGESGADYTKLQYERFTGAIADLEARGLSFAVKHCANSAAALHYPEYAMDMVRVGIALYGLTPSPCIDGKDLRPAMSFKSVISHVKTLRAGQSVSYGRAFVADRDMRVATVAIGYADGIRRLSASEGVHFLLHGCRVPLIGRICMDQLLLDISGLDDVKLGDEVTVFGEAPAMTANELAELNHTVGYEVICDVGLRVPRVYLKDGQTVRMQNYLLY